MKISEILLTEGLIKLPATTLGDMIKFFVRTYLLYYKDSIETDLVGKAYYDAKKLLDECLKEYKLDPIDDDESEKATQIRVVKQKFPLDISELPYATKLEMIYPGFKELNLPDITLELDYTRNTDATVAEYDPNIRLLRIVMVNCKLTNLESADDRKKALNQNLEQAIGQVMHELTHAIQHIVLSKFHKAQISNQFDTIAKNKGINNLKDAYLNSQVEFDPWLKGEIACFKSIEREMKKLNKDYDQKLSMEYFTASKGKDKSSYRDVDLERVMFTSPSVFFLSLRRHDETKWKKAVKLFYQSVM